MERKNYLIFGISKGLGSAITKLIPSYSDTVYGISRTAADYFGSQQNLKWVQADLSTPIEAVQRIKDEVGGERIDYLIYNVGIWESAAFSTAYDFERDNPEELLTMVNTNISACILSIQAFIENLKKSSNAKIIIVGSTWGLDNHNGKEVTFSATKFAVRGIVHALRESLRKYNIGISILNLGFLSDDLVGTAEGTTSHETNDSPYIPIQDVISAIRFILSTSKSTCVKEINMPAMQDMNV
jgi:3-oxoacyl-[acyl-carrier protein] reductase